MSDTRSIIVDQHLSWKSNTESICKSITSISVIRKLRGFVDGDTLVSILLIAVKCATFWVKLNHDDYKISKIDALDLLWTWEMK